MQKRSPHFNQVTLTRPQLLFVMENHRRIHRCFPHRFQILQKSRQFKEGVAEREGFEPSIQFPVCGLSKAVPSATRPSLPKSSWSKCCRLTSHWFQYTINLGHGGPQDESNCQKSHAVDRSHACDHGPCGCLVRLAMDFTATDF